MLTSFHTYCCRAERSTTSGMWSLPVRSSEEVFLTGITRYSRTECVVLIRLTVLTRRMKVPRPVGSKVTVRSTSHVFWTARTSTIKGTHSPDIVPSKRGFVDSAHCCSCRVGVMYLRFASQQVGSSSFHFRFLRGSEDSFSFVGSVDTIFPPLRNGVFRSGHCWDVGIWLPGRLFKSALGTGTQDVHRSLGDLL